LTKLSNTHSFCTVHCITLASTTASRKNPRFFLFMIWYNPQSYGLAGFYHRTQLAIIQHTQEAALAALIIGFGNPDRQDDGLAWHVLVRLAQRLNRPLPAGPEEGFIPEDLDPDLWFVLQLTPEMAEDFSRYERLCFVDAHTGDIPHEILIRPVEDSPAASAFTHHFTPASSLAIIQSLYQREPEAVLLSLRGTVFGFSRELSDPAQQLVDPAVDTILNWLGASQ
jgi:hydrogenase maturation protease